MNPSPKQRFFLSGAFFLQGPLLAYMANETIEVFIFLSVLFLGSAFWLYKKTATPLRGQSYHWLQMFAYSNLGMLLGWLADFDWLPLLREGVCLCGCAHSPLGEGAFCHCPFMYVGMYLGALPCFLSIKDKAQWKFCPKTFLSCLGMGPGMLLGSYCMTFMPIENPESYFFLSVLAMVLGMSLGMAFINELLKAIQLLKASAPLKSD